MRVELERIAIEPPPGVEAAEVYRVLAVEDTGAPRSLQIGTVSRVRGPTWSLMLKPENSEGEPIEVLLNAETVDELKDVIRDRFGLLDLTADRLSDNTMADATREMLRALSSLATTTHTVAGFTSALVYHLALVGAVDIKPEGRELFVDKVVTRLREELAAAVTMNESRVLLKGALKTVLDKLIKPEGGSSGPTTH